MAPPPSLRKIARELLKGAPEWVEALLQPLNSFMGQVQEGLSGQLTVKENLAQCWLTITAVGVNSRESEALPPQALPLLKGRVPYGVSVERVQLHSGTLDWFPSVDWAPTTVEGKPGIQIRTVYGLNAGARATLTLLVKAE